MATANGRHSDRVWRKTALLTDGEVADERSRLPFRNRVAEEGAEGEAAAEEVVSEETGEAGDSSKSGMSFRRQRRAGGKGLRTSRLPNATAKWSM